MDVLIWICLAVCLFSTMLGAISGIGGGVLIKPMLDLLLPLSTAQISLLSSFTVLCMALLSVAQNHFRKDRQILQNEIAVPLVIGGTAGGLLGKMGFNGLRGLLSADATVKTIQNGLLLLLILGVLIATYSRRQKGDPIARPRWAGLLVSFALGLLAAFLGIGGGPLNMLALTLFYGMTHKEGALYSLLIIVFSQSAGIVVALLSATPLPETPLLLTACAAGLLGSVFGRAAARRLTNQAVRALYSAGLVAIVMLCVANAVLA